MTGQGDGNAVIFGIDFGTLFGRADVPGGRQGPLT